MIQTAADFVRAGLTAAAICGVVSAAASSDARPLRGMMGPGAVVPEVAVAMAGGQVGPADGGTHVNPADQVNLLQWGIREGGAFAVILVILFFYRRDWKTAVDFWRDQHAITTNLVQENTKAQTETAAALRENTVVVHQAKQALVTYLPKRGGE